MLTLCIFDEPALNTFDESLAQTVVANSPSKIIEERVVEVSLLSEILDAYLPQGQEIDLLSIDVEGRDISVLESNDWSRFVPTVIMVEDHSGFDQKEGYYFEEVLKSEISQYLRSKGYKAFAKTLNTAFFKAKVA